MFNCNSCISKADILCNECLQASCNSCGIFNHIREEPLQAHNLNSICNQCEQAAAMKFCESCDQKLCIECDTVIHNKGKRMLHERSNLPSKLQFAGVKSVVFLSANYLQENLDLDAPEKFLETVSMIDKMTSRKLGENKIFLYQENLMITEAFKRLPLKNFVMFSEIAFCNLRSKTSKIEMNNSNYCIQMVSELKKSLKAVENLFIFDKSSNLPQKNLRSINGFEFYQIDMANHISNLMENYSPFEEDISTCSTRFEDISSPFSFPSNSTERKRIESIDLPETNLNNTFGFAQKPEFKFNNSPNTSEFQLFPKNNSPKQFFQFDNIVSQVSLGETASPVSDEKAPIKMTQPIKLIDLGNPKISKYLQQEFFRFGDYGEPLISKIDILSNIGATFKQNFGMNLELMIQKAEEKKLIHFTIRKFIGKEPLYFYGLLLDDLTIESLSWVLKSIKMDLMTPTEKLILSRIKECYGLKIELPKWKEILDYIIWKQTNESKRFPLKAEKILDPVTQADTYVVYLTESLWIPEDQGAIDECSVEWKEFVKFMDDFFNEDISFCSQDKKQVWNSSVENVLNRQKETYGSVSEEVRAIPGGRYGTAQFIKTCGPKTLQNMSIGRLSLFVQDLINKNLIKYERTLLIKNYPDSLMKALKAHDSKKESNDYQSGKKSKLIKRIKEVIMDILSHNPEGLSLAQIPLLLRKKIGFPINFQDLGFPKLKNFITTLMADTIKIESSGSNHSYAILISFDKKKKSMDSVEEMTQEKFSTNVFIPRQQFEPKSSNKYSTLHSSSEAKSKDADAHKTPKKHNSSLDDYLNKVKAHIESILKENICGMTVQKLFSALSFKLGCEFEYKLFNCKDFYDFLRLHVEEFIDIEVKKNIILIYPKKYRFGPQAMLSKITSESEKTPLKPQSQFQSYIKTPSTYETNSLKTPPGLGLPQNWNEYFSPLQFYGKEECDAPTPENSYSKSNGYFNMDFGELMGCEVNISNLNSTFNSRAGSSNVQQNESSVDINGSLKFIKDLLDDDEEKEMAPEMKMKNPRDLRISEDSQLFFPNVFEAPSKIRNEWRNQLDTKNKLSANSNKKTLY